MPPITKISPWFKVPVWTSIVAIFPLLLSFLASTTTPMAFLSGFAFSSLISATNWMFSKSSGTPSPVIPESGIAITSPPQSSIRRSLSDSCRYTLSRSALGRSFLVTATMMGTPAALTWSIASIVCGITPSSAATTSIATSVT